MVLVVAAMMAGIAMQSITNAAPWLWLGAALPIGASSIGWWTARRLG
jgi:hypothetical protein